MARMAGFVNLTAASLARMPMLSRLAFELAFTIARWQIRNTTRKSLGKLDRHLLQDIGLEFDIAHGESAKRFWQS